MIDIDVYCTNPIVEEFLQSLKVGLNKDYPATNVYISTASPYKHWLFNSTKLMEETEWKSSYSTYYHLHGDW